jgi:hypothetical protein
VFARGRGSDSRASSQLARRQGGFFGQREQERGPRRLADQRRGGGDVGVALHSALTAAAKTSD